MCLSCARCGYKSSRPSAPKTRLVDRLVPSDGDLPRLEASRCCPTRKCFSRLSLELALEFLFAWVLVSVLVQGFKAGIFRHANVYCCCYRTESWMPPLLRADIPEALKVGVVL